MANRIRQKRVVFYEVRNLDGGVISKPLPWPQVLSDLSRASTSNRKHRINGVDHWAQIYTMHDTDHLILARNREDAVSSFNIQTGEIVDLTSNSATPWVEVSIVHFLPNSNRFGMVLGSNSSPRASSLADWINAHRMFSKDIKIVPLISQEALAKITNATEATLLRLHLSPDQLSSVRNSRGLLSAATRIGRRQGSVDFDLVLRVKGRVTEGKKEERMRLAESAKGVIDGDFTRAVVEILNYDGNGKPQRETIDFVDQLLALKVDIAVTDDRGKPIRLQSAIQGIYRAADKYARELST